MLASRVAVSLLTMMLYASLSSTTVPATGAVVSVLIGPEVDDEVMFKAFIAVTVA